MANLDDIRARINLADVVGETVKLRKSGEQWLGQCPFHDDRSASLSISDKMFNCFAVSCGKKGDIFAWLMERDGLDFTQALRKAQAMAGVGGNDTAIRGKSTQKPKPASPPEDSRAMQPGLAEQYNKDLPPERREYYHKRGLSDETIDHFKLGWDGTRYTIPIFINGECVNIRRRRDDSNRRDKGGKIYNTSGHGKAAIFNQDILKETETVIVAEGEFDAMLLIQHGWPAVSGTGGAGTFPDEWASLFESCQVVYVCYDNDLSGRSGTTKVARIVGSKVRIATLPDDVGEGGDITDFFVKLQRTDADLEALLQEAKPYEPPAVPEVDPPKSVHLAQSAHSDLVSKRVEVKVLVAGKLDAPYIVPRKVRYTCWASDKEREFCGAANDDERSAGYWDKTFDDSSPTFIDLCHKRNEQMGRVLKAAAGCNTSCKKFNYQPLEYVNVEEILAVPMADRVTPNGGKEVDESGNEYVARNLYLLDAKAVVNQYYKEVGRVYPHPNTQLGTILITNQEPLQDSISQFELTDEVKALLSVFRPKGNLVEHVQALLDDLANNVTRIYKRDEALLATLLGFHSVLTFEFEGRPIRRGWLEVLLLGDTGLGKTEIVRTLMDYCGLGTLVSGETTTRTGLTYAVEQVGERWFVKWGKYPLNDRRLLAIDELSELPEDDLGKMTQGRNDGVLRVDRAGVGETNCRTRLIWMSNPRFKKGLYDFSHGIEALKTLFPTPADLRRLDLAVFLATKDVDLNEINRMRSKPKERLVSAAALKASVLWAWSRKLDDIVIDDRATEAILDEASRLSGIYGSAEDVPLVSPADMRNKLARMVVALAALLHSTDEDHNKIVVQPVHVKFIGAYLDSVYQAKNCRYDVYAGYASQKSKLTDVEAEDILAELNALDTAPMGPITAVSRDTLALYRQHDVLTVSEIADLLDLDRRTVTKRIKVFQKHQLVSKSRHGFHKTPKFVEYLSRT